MAAAHRPRVFLDVNIGEEPIGRLTIELFTDKTPNTCENFRQLCTGECKGLTYARTPFHRVIDEFMIQGGDITNGDGTGSANIFTSSSEDENLDWREIDAPGLVCSADRGKDTSGSQFFITLEPTPHLNGKHRVFGRLVSGQDTLARIAEVDVDEDDRPLEPVLVERCGELEKRKKRSAPQEENMAPTDNADRGRRRNSNGSDIEMENSPEPGSLRKLRRHSDKMVDEGLRGRPRQRSGSRSPPSRALSTPDEDDEDDEDRSSPAKKHKRKRSASPSRHLQSDIGDKNGSFERRRRSLPNQYNDDRPGKYYPEGDRYKPSPRRDDRRYAGGGRDERYRERREDDRGDRYRPSKDRYGDDGRLDGAGRLEGGSRSDHDPPVKFKGRGIMKYRESGRL